MEMNWSRWFRCESSFGLLLVPSQPGIFALAEEVAQTVGAQQRRMLAVFEVAEADDLSRAMSRLFAAGSQWREKMAEARIYVRYAIAPSIADRRAAATALKNWLSAQKEVASQIFEKVPTTVAEPSVAVSVGGTSEMRPERRASRAQHEGAFEMKTVAERAVDRVTHGIKLGKAVPAGS
jgi:acyl-CoA reductase-like NAD-dependent aldehyde dehydrogenase